MLSKNKGVYVFLDPFDRIDSGVSSYICLAIIHIERLGINTKTIKLNKNEKIDDFRKRVPYEVGKIQEKILCIEAPESLAATANLSSSLPIHIRLHCSKSLGAAVQGLPYSNFDIEIEQKEINRARYLSAPSWAAYFASLSLFKFPNIPLFYPNPAPEVKNTNSNPAKYDVLFVGRLQFLKGLHYLESSIKQLPDFSFAIASPPTKNWDHSKRKNVSCFDGTLLTKDEIYNLSNTVIVPSIFETSSMVALEALAYGCQVITWKHLGVSEYLDNESSLIKVTPNDLDQFIKKIKENAKTYKKKTAVTTGIINQKFYDGINQILNSSDLMLATLIRPDKEIEHYLRKLIGEQTFSMKKKKKSSFAKKAHKLLFHPIAFFRDSKEAKFIRRKIHERRETKFLILRDKLYPQQARSSTGIAEYIHENTPEQEQLLLPPAVPPHSLYAHIPETGRIEFSPPPSKYAGYITALFFSSSEDQDFIDELLEKLDEFDDFKYVNRSRLHVGTFNITPEESALSIINRIDVKNKTNLSKINSIILVNAPASLCLALRSIGTNHRVILVKSNNNIVVDPHSIDALITTNPDNSSEIRRQINLESRHHVPTAIRRVLQEGFPKNPDMLLSLYVGSDCGFTKEEFSRFNSKQYQGIIKVKSSQSQPPKNMLDIYETLSQSVVGIAVLESVYMRYRSLCESVESGAPPKSLVELCLTDGIIFDVQEV